MKLIMHFITCSLLLFAQSFASIPLHVTKNNKQNIQTSQILLDVISDTITKDSYSLFNNQEEGQTGYQDSMLKAL
ncbi:MAG: hypothetical protein LBL13_00025, partial [Bacteroidales bacterium]|nr:hypothetical protein [Bacteroidales bacterium]